MKTKQNEAIGRIGPIPITRVSSSSKKIISAKARKSALSEKLVDFLNVDIKKPEEIRKYCKEHAYLPKDVSKGWSTGFIKEQDEVKQIAKRIVGNKIKEEDIIKIAESLKDLKIKVRLVTEEQLDKLNEDLCRVEKSKNWAVPLNQSTKRKFIIEVREYTNMRMGIWDSLLSLLKTKRPLRQCKDTLRCRRFFIPSKYNPRQKFCSTYCEDRFKHRKGYKARKRQKTSK